MSIRNPDTALCAVRRFCSFLLFVSVLGAITVAGPAATGAQVGIDGRLELLSQTSWVDPNGTFSIEVLAEATTDATVEFTVFNRVTSRSEFDLSIESGPSTRPIISSIGEIGSNGVVGATFDLSSEPNQDRLFLSEPGVYPVEVSLLDVDRTRITSFTTHLIRVPADLGEQVPLSVAVTLPINTGFALRPNGDVLLNEADESTIDALTDVLSVAKPGSVSVSIQPETIEALDEDALADLQAATQSHLLLATPYVNLDPTGWFEAGLDSEFIDGLAVGLTTTIEELATPNTNVWLANRTLTPQTLTRIGGLGYDRIVLDPLTIEPLDEEAFPLTLTQKFLVEDNNGQSYEAGEIDASLQARFPEDDDPELAAHRALADLAVLFFDQPGIERGAIVAPPPDWDLDASFLRVLLSGMADNPILDPVDLDTWFTQVSLGLEGGQGADIGFELIRDLDPEDAPNLSQFSVRYREAGANLFSFGSIVGEGTGAEEQLGRLLLVAGSENISAAQSDTFLAAIDESIEEVTGSIVVQDPPSRVTFAAASGDVPIVIENTGDIPLNVLVEMSSDKLTFPDGADITVLLEPGLNEVFLPVSARTSGDSILDLEFSSPDRSISISERRVTVRSTQLSGVGLAIAAIALVFLMIWWVRTHRSRKPDSRLVRSKPEDQSNVRETTGV